MNTIVAENLTIGYDKNLPLLVRVNFKLTDGIYILLGANGSGKSALLKTIAGLLKPLEGDVYVNGVRPYNVRRKHLARIIGYVWQNPFYGFVEPTVEKEILFINKQTGVEGDRRVVFKLVPLELFDRSPFTLSGGEAKRVSIASVLSLNQPIWLLDEPFNELDYSGVKVLIDLVGHGRVEGKIIIVTTHYPSIAELVNPDYYMLIDKYARSIKIEKWENLTDDELIRNEVIPRRIRREPINEDH